ncbi:MAG: STAS domain-containing protein [Desulfobacterales bacterium]
MEISQKEENGIVSISIKGRLDADSAPEAEKVVKEALEGQTTRVLFNLSGLEYLSSAGLRVRFSQSGACIRRLQASEKESADSPGCHQPAIWIPSLSCLLPSLIPSKRFGAYAGADRPAKTRRSVV